MAGAFRFQLRRSERHKTDASVVRVHVDNRGVELSLVKGGNNKGG